MNNGSRWCVSEESAAVTGVGTGKEGGAAGQARMPGSLLNLCFSSPPNLVHAYSSLCPGLMLLSLNSSGLGSVPSLNVPSTLPL